MSVLKNVINGLPEAMRSWRGARLSLPVTSGFWRGKQFRAYRELAGTDSFEYFRFVASAPFHLHYQSLQVYTGTIRLSIFVDSTPSGTWVDAGMIRAKYRINGVPASTVVIETGGTFTGGTEQEVLKAIGGGQGTGNANQALHEDNSIRGLPAGSYYILAEHIGASTGMYILEYEDLDSLGM